MQARASLRKCGRSVFTAKIPGSVGFVVLGLGLNAIIKMSCVFNVCVYPGPIIWRNIGGEIKFK